VNEVKEKLRSLGRAPALSAIRQERVVEHYSTGVLPRWAVCVILVFSVPNMPEFNPIRPYKESQGSAPPPERQGLPEEAVLLRIFIGEDDHYKRLPLYEAIVLKARNMHLAGATVIRGFLGFGKSSHMHAAKILRLSMDLPMVVEIVDVPEKVNTFLPYLEPMMSGGLVTLERARVIGRKQATAQK